MANMYINAMTDLWNSAGTTYSSIKMNVTNAASAAASKLLQLQIASVDKFAVDKDGNMIAAGTLTSAGTISSASHLPSTNDAAALGASGTAWSDLYLASGGVINWSAADVTVTHSEDQLFFGGAVNGYRFDAALRPQVSDGAAIGSSLTPWSDLYLATGAVVDFGGDVSVTHAADLLNFTGAASGYSFDARLRPITSDGAALGDTLSQWSDLYLASGAVVNYSNGNVTLTHATGNLTLTNGDFRVTTAGTNGASVVTVAGTQTLTGKTLTGASITGSTFSGTTGSFSTSINAGRVTSGQILEGASSTILANVSASPLYFRPNGAGSGTEQVTIDTAANVVTTGSFTAIGQVTSTQNFVSSGASCVIAATGGAGNVYLRPNGAASSVEQGYQANDGGFRSCFFHTTGGGTSTHSFYNGNGPIGASSWGILVRGNGSANTGAGHFMPYPTSGVVTYLGFHQPSVNWWAIYAAGPCITTVSWAVSDAKFKSDIKDCDCADAYSKVKAIGVKSYHKENVSMQRSGANEIGFIAQEVEPLIPEAVMDVPIAKNDAEGNPVDPTESMKVTNDRTLLATLWAAVQHQAHLIEALEAKLEGKAHG
jgi:Chaperone of endosialidase